jgi:OTT_1508-like deaminase
MFNKENVSKKILFNLELSNLNYFLFILLPLRYFFLFTSSPPREMSGNFRRGQGGSRSGNHRGSRDGSRGGSRSGSRGGNWQDFPPREEHQTGVVQQMEKQQRLTRRVIGSSFTPSQLDVQNLLAAISKIERKERSQVALQRLTPRDEGNPPHFSPTQQHWRLAKSLDSLANLCVSETNHEVIATALRVDYKAESIELIVASNTNVQDSTVSHLQEIWRTLQRMSTLSHEKLNIDRLQKTPPRNVDDAEVSKLSDKFIQLCLEFSFSRLQKRVNNKFDRFSAIEVHNSNPDDPFRTVQTLVCTLEAVFTRDQGAIIGKPSHDDTEKWMGLWKTLKATKKAIDTFLNKGFSGYESYLRKVESFANDIEVLVKLTISPQCKQLFACKFKVTPLCGEFEKASSVPQTPKDWKTVLEKALLFRNAYKSSEAEEYVIDVRKIEEDTAYMASEWIKPELVIHCEVRVLLHIFKIEKEMPGTSKAYTYIGVSKLSCRGCQAFFESFNREHGTRFVTRGSHGKSYWPWQFPQFPPSLPRSDTVLRETYRTIADRWVVDYDGYTVYRVALGPDSEAQSGTSGSYTNEPTPDLTAQTSASDNPIPNLLPETDPYADAEPFVRLMKGEI